MRRLSFFLWWHLRGRWMPSAAKGLKSLVEICQDQGASAAVEIEEACLLKIEVKQPSLCQELQAHHNKIWREEVLRRDMMLRCDAREIAAAGNAGRN